MIIETERAAKQLWKSPNNGDYTFNLVLKGLTVNFTLYESLQTTN